MSETFPIINLARHGETACTLNGQRRGLTDLPLTERGEDNARRLDDPLRQLTFAMVFTGPLRRAMQTCELAGFQSSAVTDHDRAEFERFEPTKTASRNRRSLLERLPSCSPGKWTSALTGSPVRIDRSGRNMMKGRQLLHEEGQSLWLGNITRDLMDSGTLKPDIGELSVTGPTSNPVISTRRLTIVGTGTPGAQRGCEIGTQTKRSSSRKLGETLEAISANSAWHHDCYADISGGPRYALLPALAACS